MERLIVRGGRRLHGTVHVAGNKNAAGPVLAAALLTDEPVRLRNLPRIGDIEVFIQLLRGLGVEVEPEDDELVASAARVSAQPSKGVTARPASSTPTKLCQKHEAAT